MVWESHPSGRFGASEQNSIMPSYEYECATCGVFTEFRSMDERDRPGACAICDGLAPRIISAPHLAVMQPLQRMAAVRNERSQHEPRVGVKTTCCAGKSCRHKRGAAKTKDGKPKLLSSTKRNRRPWMLGH
jgi:putative FmdB family regulatory protein